MGVPEKNESAHRNAQRAQRKAKREQLRGERSRAVVELEERCRRSGITRTALAEQLGVTKSAIGRIFNGEVDPRSKTIQRMSWGIAMLEEPQYMHPNGTPVWEHDV